MRKTNNFFVSSRGRAGERGSYIFKDMSINILISIDVTCIATYLLLFSGTIAIDSLLCYLMLGERQDTKEFFRDPEFLRDLEELLRRERDGEAGGEAECRDLEVGEAAAEEPRLATSSSTASTVMSSAPASSADSTMVGEVHLR